MLVALCGEHTIHRKVCADFAQKIDVIEVEKPVGIIDENRRVFALETHKFRHLLLEAIDVVLNGLFCHHRAHIRTSGRVADHCSTATDKNDGTMACVLQTLCDYHLHKMTDVKAVRRRVETDVEGLRTFVEQLFEVFFKNHLFNQSAFAKLVDNVL